MHQLFITIRIMDFATRFRELHSDGLFVMPNAWDVGSARILQQLGFPAIATTSSGFAASLGRADLHVRRDELLAHVAALTSAVSVPISVDAEQCFPDDEGGIAKTVDLLVEAGASGLSIEDYEPATGVLAIDVATARVGQAVARARKHGVVLTARAENYLYGKRDLADTIRRLSAYRDAGADVVYAPGLTDVAEIERLVTEVESPLNVLAVPGAPAIATLASLGVRRVSTGGALASVAYGALAEAATQLRDSGTTAYLDATLKDDLRQAAFDS